MVVHGYRAYIADGSSGLQVVDYSDPTSPVILWTVDTPGTAQNVVLEQTDTYLFVADGVAGVHVIDISYEPPIVIGTLNNLIRSRGSSGDQDNDAGRMMHALTVWLTRETTSPEDAGGSTASQSRATRRPKSDSQQHRVDTRADGGVVLESRPLSDGSRCSREVAPPNLGERLSRSAGAHRAREHEQFVVIDPDRALSQHFDPIVVERIVGVDRGDGPDVGFHRVGVRATSTPMP
jgi:hypothetical protein